MSQPLSQELAVALEASKRAAKLVMRYFEQGVAVEQKADASPVTVADREAEALIKGMLYERFPEYGFLGEESGQMSIDREYVWVIDPIDGTKNFIRHIPIFGILIGLMQGGACSLGVSNVPGMREVLYGQKGLGAFLNGEPVHASAIHSLAESAVNCGGLKHFRTSGRFQGLDRLIDRAARIRGFGDAYAYHMVASGRMEAVVETKIRIWDIAAPVAIIEAAGGKCTDIDGNRITTDTTTIIASNGKVHDELVALFR